MRLAPFKALACVTALSGCVLFGGGAGSDPRGIELKKRGAIVVLALERYRRDNSRLPEHLFELLPKYLPQLPDGLATDYQPADNTLAFSYERRPGGLVTTCRIEIGRRVWDCDNSL
jgi:hypothetical protein